MAVVTTQVSFSDLRALAAFELNATRTFANWTAAQLAFIVEIVKGAYEAVAVAYDWSWRKPQATLSVWPTTTGTLLAAPVYSSPQSTITMTGTVGKFYPSMVGHNITFTTSGISYLISSYSSGAIPALTIKVVGDASSEAPGDTFTITANGDYRLPDNFGNIASKISFAAGANYSPFPVVSDAEVRLRRSRVESTARPFMGAVLPLAARTGTSGVDDSFGQAFDLMLYPTPDAVYALSFRMNYLIELPDLTASTITNPVYPLGGADMSPVYREAVMAEIEERTGLSGPHVAKFARYLVNAINADRGRRPQVIGYNRDHSDDMHHTQNEMFDRNLTVSSSYLGPL